MTALALYRAASTLGGPLIGLYLAHRRATGKEDRERFGERLGIATCPRPRGCLAWLHAASVGEALALLPLIAALRERWPMFALLLTTGTVTSARLLADRLPPGVRHQYVPVDRPSYVSRFLEHWRPDVVVWAESEFWPNLLSELKRRSTPVILVNGRVSARSFARWQRFPETIGTLLSTFSVCLGQSQSDTERLRRLGASSAEYGGNLKFAADPLPVDARLLAELDAAVGGRPCWLAASTHPGEEAIAAGVHRALSRIMPELLTIIVPRHPNRGHEVARELSAHGFVIARRAASQPLTRAVDLYVADTMGELGLFFCLADVAFIGKSLTARGGQNPLEAALLEAAIVHGPGMDNFVDIAERLRNADASETVADERALEAAVGRLLTDDSLRRRRCRAALAVARAESGVVDIIVDAIARTLPVGAGD